ncbi:MAG: DNA repair exonuclease [Verrucomicrobiales bacterium]|nr:DNA repair exonuclease [Verrucomicrobiales bacterium]
MGFRFIHAADLHLDSPLRGLGRYAGAPVGELRGATRGALVNLVELAIAEEVAFLVIAGDVYDGDWKDYQTGLFFASQMVRLREAGVRVFLISGNHDAASVVSRKLGLPDNVHVFPTAEAGSVVLEGLGVVVHGQGFAKREVTEDLSAGYPAAVAGCFNIGILHTSLNGREGHDSYAPCSVAGLVARGYDYWALGHVHTRELVNERGPVVLFPGNVQGRHARETGAKGATLVEVVDGEVVSLEHRDLDVVRWERAVVDLSGVVDAGEVAVRVGRVVGELEDGGRLLAVRVELTGETVLHGALLGDVERWRNGVRAAVTDVRGGGGGVVMVAVGTREVGGVEAGGELVDLLGVIEGDAALVEVELGVLPAEVRRLLVVEQDKVVAEARALLEEGLS